MDERATAEEMMKEACERVLSVPPISVKWKFNPGEPVVFALEAGLIWTSRKPTPEEREAIESVEREYGLKVLAAMRDETSIGTMLSMLYVSSYKEDWPVERSSLKSLAPLAWVENMDDSTCSEFGHIGIEFLFGGRIMRRTW